MNNFVKNDTQYILQYPVLVIELPKRPDASSLFVIHNKSQFTTFTRLPSVGQYSAGAMFDSAGFEYAYKGESGPFRLSRKSFLKKLLENLVLPALVFNIFSRLVYFGPNLTSNTLRSLEEFKVRILSKLREQDPKDKSLAEIDLSRATNFEASINAIEHWQYFGGNRDEDGHLLK